MNPRQTAIFRHVLKATGCPFAAANAAKTIPPGGKLRLRKTSLPRVPAAAPAPEQDLDRAVAALESEAVRRALAGVDIPVFHQGRECGNTVKHSDQLLMFLLKTLHPERYGVCKEASPPPAARPVVLEIDLTAADAEPEGDEG